jgi:outer membrane protein OmpA-like peptidoglycan-associated protein
MIAPHFRAVKCLCARHFAGAKYAPEGGVTTGSGVFVDMVSRRLPPAAHSTRRRRPLPLVLAASLVLLVAACSSNKSQPEQAGTKPVSSSEFPNLATVPNEAPPVTPRPEREQLLQGLTADRANAEYSGEPLDAGTANQPPAPPPPPAPPVPEGGAAGSTPAAPDAGATTESATAPAESSPPPPQTAALPTNLGDPTALIYFNQGSADLTDHDRAVLHDVTVMYRRERNSRLRVIGHASKAEGGDTATTRADAVAKTLAELGVPASAIEIVSGSGGPVYDESQPTGAAANRRVEIFLGP